MKLDVGIKSFAPKSSGIGAPKTEREHLPGSRIYIHNFSVDMDFVVDVPA